MAEQRGLKRKSLSEFIELYARVTARITAARNVLLLTGEIVLLQQKVELRIIRDFAKSTKEQLNDASENAGTALSELKTQSIEMGNPADIRKALSDAIQILEAVRSSIKHEFGYGYNIDSAGKYFPDLEEHFPARGPEAVKRMQFGNRVPDPTDTTEGNPFVMMLHKFPYDNPSPQGSGERALTFTHWLRRLRIHSEMSMEKTLNSLMKTTIISPGGPGADGEYMEHGDPDELLTDIANYIADTYYTAYGNFDADWKQLPPLDDDFFINRFDVRFLDISTEHHDALGRFYRHKYRPKAYPYSNDPSSELAQLWDSVDYRTPDGQMMIQLVFSRINEKYGNREFVYKRGKEKDYKKVDSVYPVEKLDWYDQDNIAMQICTTISAVKNAYSLDEPMTIAPKWLKAFFYPQNFEKAGNVTTGPLDMPEWLFKYGSATFCDDEDCVRINVGESVSGTFFKFKLSDGSGRRAWGFFPHINPSARDPDAPLYESMWSNHWNWYENAQGPDPSFAWDQRTQDLVASVPIKVKAEAKSIPAGPVLAAGARRYGRRDVRGQTPNTHPYVPLWTSADMTVQTLMDKVENGTIWDMLVVTDKPLPKLTDEATSMTTNTASQDEIQWALFYRKLAVDQFGVLMSSIIRFNDDGEATGIQAAFTDLAIN